MLHTGVGVYDTPWFGTAFPSGFDATPSHLDSQSHTHCTSIFTLHWLTPTCCTLLPCSMKKMMKDNNFVR